MDEYEDKLDVLFTALAHPTRRKILNLLVAEDRCVTGLADSFSDSLNVVSKHIKCLERAGLVNRRCEGRVHNLQLDAAPLAEAAEFIERYRKRWERQLDRLTNYLNELEGKQKGHAKSKTKL